MALCGNPPPGSKAWVDPATLPVDPGADIAAIAGNAPDYVKQLTCNVFYAYGVVDRDVFGYAVGGDEVGAVTVAEVGVTKHMLNGAGMLHGGACASTPLVVLGVLTNTNGVGVTQGMNVLFHAPAPVGSLLRITSSSISMGSRVMSAKCEITDKASGRVVASALLNKMQPVPVGAKL
ncbi:hypothetical protein B0H13DRAFT_2448181 [Mycena leptocephala]|nr:hypothetical protein B0H13DRAFT_2448181 [Mycena leptocephala]